ncbi:MAG: hypothetical protein WC159_11935, partial [Sphaerochaetaceae bacterium]
EEKHSVDRLGPFDACSAVRDESYLLCAQSYQVTSARLSALGGSYSESFLVNPANLGQGAFKLSLPFVGVPS